MNPPGSYTKQSAGPSCLSGCIADGRLNGRRALGGGLRLRGPGGFPASAGGERQAEGGGAGSAFFINATYGLGFWETGQKLLGDVYGHGEADSLGPGRNRGVNSDDPPS